MNPDLKELRAAIEDLTGSLNEFDAVKPTTDPMAELVEAALWALYEDSSHEMISTQRRGALGPSALVLLPPTDAQRSILRMFFELACEQATKPDAVDPHVESEGKPSTRA